jgi:sulfite dehydrogenase
MRRRDILTGIGASAVTGRAFAAVLNPALPPGVLDTAVLERLPGKQPLIKLTYRPPNYETPLDGFRTPITANDRFFVRYHLADIPDMDRLRKDFTLKIGGDAAGRPVTLTLEDLHKMPTAEVTAVCQCAGNRRGFSSPHVPGVEWGAGAMGNAVWSGVRLKDILARAGIAPGALEIGLAGADGPVLDTTPAFRKSLPLEKAMDENVIVAFAMNHQPLPHFNGYPIRLVVPGWTATYWMKHLTQLDIRSKPLDSFWMQKSYRVPKGLFPVDQPFTSQEAPETSAITEIVVNSLITNQADGAKLPIGGSIIQGIAWDRGHGIKSAEVSFDGGTSWRNATLGSDLGRYAFRPFTLDTGKLPPGRLTILARATSNAGEAQAEKLKFNAAGYQNNVPMPVSVTVS